ncbi:MAG: macrolide transporter subunit MacA [Firmicutes bacterium ADurb.Bin467]|nr:MAG: macrolide transporter subunit MacA [Firmicutes bacterium ADurb.Bin467]
MAHKKRRALRWLIPLVLILVVVGFFALRPRASIRYIEAAAFTGDISTTYSFTGNIIAPRRQTISAPASATVKDVYVAANEQVKSGDRLIKLSTGAVLKSDLAGEIVRLNAREDDVVTPGMELMTIVDVDELEVEISVDEYDVEAVSIGKPVEITVNALGIDCGGTVKSLDKDADTSGGLSTYTAAIAVDAPEGVLPGMQVEVRMLNQSAAGVTLLKVDALQFSEDNRAYVLVKDANGKYVSRFVETGINDGANVEIRSGLASGETVYYAPGETDMMSMMMQMRGGGLQ